MNSFSFPASIIKSGEESDSRVKIRIIPSRPSRDRVNDRILLKAFDDDCIKSFLHDGVIDYDHLSLLGDSPAERATAIIGEPENLFIDKQNNVPVCDAFLFKGNPYVDNSILPALRSGSKVYGASLGGKVLMKSTDIDPETKQKGMSVSKMRLKHIAVTPLQKAVHQGTKVTLRKSMSEEQEDEYNFTFSNMDDFLKSFDNAEIFLKTLQAGSVTDVANLSGGQAVQKQSLEGDRGLNSERMKAVLPFILEAILQGKLSGDFNSFKNYLLQRGLSEKESDSIAKTIAVNAHKIVKMIF